jgi:hypothetical protein
MSQTDSSTRKAETVTEYDTTQDAQRSGEATQTALIIVLLIAGFLMLHGAFPQEQATTQPRIIVATPTLGLPPVPTLMPTLPPQLIVIERQADAAAPAITYDNSVNVCIGFCPGGSR